MATRPIPTVRLRRLAAELRRLRSEKGLTHQDVEEASHGDVSHSTVFRYESMDRVPSLATVRVLMEVYGVTGDERDALLALAREARSLQSGWWQPYKHLIPDWFAAYVAMETEAWRLREYLPELVPGQLQTSGYYQAFLSASPADVNIERRVEIRAKRQERLTGQDPLTYWAVLNEAVIRRNVGGPEVMREQLRHILDMSELHSVTIQVLPFSAGAHPAMDGTFSILGFADGDPTVVYVETRGGSLYSDQADDTESYVRMFDHLVASALGERATRDMISEIIASLPD